MLRRFLPVLLGVCFVAAAVGQTRPTAAPSNISLSGIWRFALDPSDSGVQERRFSQDLSGSIHLPGSLQEQGFGDPPSIDSKWAVNDISLQTFLKDDKYAPYRTPENFKSPFWLTPTRFYYGVAWYQRDIHIPDAWKDEHIRLHLQRPHWQTEVWVDDRDAGSQNSLGAPHDYDLTDLLSPGKHRLTIRIDNRLNIPVGPHAHSVTDMTQTNWNGIIGDISLKATNKIWMDDVRVFPNVAGRKIRVAVTIGNHTAVAGQGTIVATVAIPQSSLPVKDIPVQWTDKGGSAEFEYELGSDAPLWDEFSPALDHLSLQLKSKDGRLIDTSGATFGLREISTSGTQFILNGRPIQFRGTLECAIFPLTGYPPTDVKSWKRILGIARSYGLNHLRFHTWCPPEAAFVAADEMGFYFEVECSCWGRFGTGGPLDTWMPAEGDRMLRAYGNHPSFMLMVATNEPKGDAAAKFLADVVHRWKQNDPRRLYSAGAGAAEVISPPSDFHIEYATRLHNFTDGELQQPPQTISDYRKYATTQPVPQIAHELGQWCAYPNFDEIPKFNGVLRAGNLEIYRDFLTKAGMISQAHDFLMASGKLQVELYKAEIEKILRTPNMSGFELLDLHDFPGQGTSPVGVLDEFWDSKGYVTPQQYSRFCNQTVPLALMAKRIFTTVETADIGVEISHFGPDDLKNTSLTWKLRDAANNILSHGSIDAGTIPTGKLTSLGNIKIPLHALSAPGKFNFELAIDNTSFANDWDFWVYPPSVDLQPPASVTIVHDVDDATLRSIADGQTMLLLLPPQRVAGDTFGAFESIFWNRILFPKEQVHTLGIVCDPKHPALSEFPTDDHSDWQWSDLLEHSKPMLLDKLPKELSPIIQPIDDWNLCRKLGLLIEARLGKGRLIICSIDLQTDLLNRPVARQMLHSLLQYIGTGQFNPGVALTEDQIKSLVTVPR